MAGLDPAGGSQATRPLRFGQGRQAWVWGIYPLLWLLTWVGSRSAQPQLWGIPAWYWGAGLAVLLLVPLNFYFVRTCWPRAGDE
ncbi:hypothetical protein [Synechococcus sp. H65.1]|uniref:hypothetical protein n=1 Tax=unclassified Synechococcus TaxID=2626047 RepID=UPI0039C36F7B